MGLVTGSSCFLHSPFRNSLFPTSSSQCSFNPPFSLSSLRNASARRRNKATLACLQQENPRDSSCRVREVILFIGIAVIPLLKRRAEAVVGTLAAENTEWKGQDQEQKRKLLVEGSSPNPYFALIHVLSFLGLGVLLALHASAKNEEATSDATIESMDIKLKKKEDSVASLGEKTEAELLNEEEDRNEAFAEANEERQSLVNELKLANDVTTNLIQELHNQKISIEELNIRVDDLEVCLQEASHEKRELKHKLDFVAVLQERMNLLSSEIKDKEVNLHHLDSKLAEREGEFNQLSFVYQQSQDQLSSLNSEIKQMKDVLFKNVKEQLLKNEMAPKLRADITFSLSKNDEFSKNLEDTLKEYSHFKSCREMQYTADATILREREEKIHQLEEQLKLLLDEVKRDKGLISDLTGEKENLKETLCIELENVKNLEQELTITRETLVKLKNEVSDVAKQLQQSRNLCSELKAEVSEIKAEFSKARESSQRSIDKGKRNVEVLAGEVGSADEILRGSNEELQLMFKELANAVQKCDSLARELVDAGGKAESAALDLKEERENVSTLNKELEVLDTQISKDTAEARKGLELDLEEAIRTLDEMNQNASLLSRELGLSSSQISSRGDEKDAPYKGLDEQKQASRATHKNSADCHDMVVRLGKEREALVKKGKRLEEELASAKGEILWLRSQNKSSETPVSDQSPKKVDIGSQTRKARKVSRRRRVNPQQEDS